MDWSPGYRELAPPPELRDMLSCLWVRIAPPAGAPPARILPDACADLIWRSGVGGFVAGPDTSARVTPVRDGEVLVGARFVPGAGGAALGLSLDALRDARVPLQALWPRLHRRLDGELEPAAALRLVASTAVALAASGEADPAVRRAVTRLADPRLRVEDLAAELELSERQLRRRFQAAVGYGPKTLQRVLRFRRFLAGAQGSGQRPDLAVLALEAGYADQAHLTRDCTRLGGLPPARLTRAAA